MNIEVFGCKVSRVSCGGIDFLMAARAMSSLNLEESMDHSEIEKISKALADETRLKIFETISATKHMNCGEIVSIGGVTPATVSHHLKILCDAGLIACRREGQFVYSQAIPRTVTAYARALTRIARGKETTRRR
jgi:ArsR family transcriptional regulator, arsenate/arsenite/antimonite-responsive transcriptional repressor